MEIRPIEPSETEEARCLLQADGWDRGVASAEEFRELLSRSQKLRWSVQVQRYLTPNIWLNPDALPAALARRLPSAPVSFVR